MSGWVEAEGIVLSARLTARVIEGVAVELWLAVTLPSGARMPVAFSSVIARPDRARVRPGAALPVALDPDRPSSLRIDWTRAA